MFKKKQPPEEMLKGFEQEMNFKALQLGRDTFEQKECFRRGDELQKRIDNTTNEMKQITDKWAKLDKEQKAKTNLKVVENDVEDKKE